MKTSLLKYLIFLIPFMFLKAQIPEWNIIGQMPLPVAGGNAVVFNNKIYILGGYLDSLQASTDLIQSYNPKTNEWQIVAKMNAPRSYFAAGVNSQGVYYAGGTDVFTQTENANEYLEFWNFDSTQSPIVLYSSPWFDKYYVTGIVDEFNIFLIGGISYGILDSNPSLISGHSLIDNTTMEINDFFIGDSSDVLYEHMSTRLGNKIYIIGGFLKGISQQIISFKNDFANDNTFQNSLLTPRASGQAVAIPENNEIFIIGGQNELSLALNSVEIIKVETNKITNEIAQPINKARSDFMSVLFENKIYIFGGYDEYGNILSEIEVLGVITNINESKQDVINTFNLEQNYPNPFNPSTTIKYTIPNVELLAKSFYNVKLKIYDILGTEVITLVNKKQNTGTYEVLFDASSLSSGIYFYKLNVGSFTKTKSMLLLK